MKGLNSTIKDYVIFSTFLRKDWNEVVCEDFIAKIHVYPTDFLLNLRSCFKFIPRQIETYVEADWSSRYAVNSGLLTKIKGFKMRDRGSIWPEHTCLQ